LTQPGSCSRQTIEILLCCGATRKYRGSYESQTLALKDPDDCVL
jgi:hypothetical protein